MLHPVGVLWVLCVTTGGYARGFAASLTSGYLSCRGFAARTSNDFVFHPYGGEAQLSIKAKIVIFTFNCDV